MKETIVKINKTKSLFFDRLTNPQPDSSRKKEKNQINKIRNENGEITTDNTEIQRIIRDYYQNYMTIKWTTWKIWTNSQKSITFQN